MPTITLQIDEFEVDVFYRVHRDLETQKHWLMFDVKEVVEEIDGRFIVRNARQFENEHRLLIEAKLWEMLETGEQK